MVFWSGIENRATDKDRDGCKFAFFRAGVWWPQDWSWRTWAPWLSIVGGSGLQESSRHCCVNPSRGTRTCPQAALLSPVGPFPLSASPPFPDQPMWVPALWGSGKVLETDAYALKIRHGGSKKVHCFSHWEHRSEAQALRKQTLCQAQASSIIWVLHQVSPPPFGIRRRNAERQTNVQLHQIPA